MSDVGLKQFDEGSKWVLQVAALEAHLLNCSAIGTVHILLGILRSQDPLLSGVLDRLGLGGDDQRQAVVMSVYQFFAAEQSSDEELKLLRSRESGSAPLSLGATIPQLTSQSRQVCWLANEESQWLDQQEIGAVSLLLGLAHYGRGGTAVVLEKFGLSLEAIRREVVSSYLGGARSQIIQRLQDGAQRDSNISGQKEPRLE